ncbi:response regulator transcription factor [Nordella sp. HKS 07]|uniref:response regulator transcription factor n=1 Tax=Nordella sp. HKS 07 TaxID=2712222 RepID=UPI001FEE25CA|nr:response regulator [Nordella sp. HKS 07]
MYLVDDDPSVLRAVKRLLTAGGFDTRAYSDPALFLAEHNPSAPGCILLDMALPGLSGVDVQRRLAAAHHRQPVIFISGASDVPATVTAMKGGAADFLIKPFDETDLLRAVRQAIERNATERAADAEFSDITARINELTPRERAVFFRVIAGRLNKQIAADLRIVEKTVKVHRARVMKKMGVRTLAELVRLAYKHGLADEAESRSASEGGGGA